MEKGDGVVVVGGGKKGVRGPLHKHTAKPALQTLAGVGYEAVR
jgi:hypothetical protein